MPAWFFHPETPGGYLTGLNEISYLIEEILEEEYELCQNLFLGGFSQGGVTSLYTGLVTSTVPLLGIICLSIFVPFGRFKEQYKNLPLFLYHGDKDEILDQKSNEIIAKKFLKKFNYVYIKEKGLGHTYSWAEFIELKKWMAGCLKNEKL